jgi:hypothetical protein
MMNEFDNGVYQKVSKPIARKLFRAGCKVYVLPCKVSLSMQVSLQLLTVL